MNKTILFSGLLILLVALMLGCVTPPICGNNICENGEDSYNCSQDCGLPESTSKTAWKSAEPWAIVDWDLNFTNVILILKNNSFETLDLNAVKLSSSDYWYAGKEKVVSGATLTVLISNETTCPEGSDGKKYAFPKSNISINYSTESILNKVQTGVADIVGTC